MGNIIFLSYASIDSKIYKIPEIAKRLRKLSEIDEVLFWEESVEDDIIDYMETNLFRCDIFILFCSQNALKSDPVGLEWKAALKKKKKIIPVFINEDDIPTLISPKLGIKFKINNLGYNIENIYKTIRKKLRASIRQTKTRKKSNSWEGYCLRCNSQIYLNPDKPYCYNCYEVWAEFGNPYYAEKFCHQCGNSFLSSLNQPLCDTCLKYWNRH